MILKIIYIVTNNFDCGDIVREFSTRIFYFEYFDTKRKTNCAKIGYKLLL